MALEITTVGASVSYAVEATAGTRPTSGFTKIPDVNTAPEIALDVDALDASNIEDLITRYVAGRQDPGGAKAFTLNHTEAAITAWATLCTASATAKASGKLTWIQYKYPSPASKAFFFAIDPVTPLGNAGIEQNSVSTLNATFVVTKVEGWGSAATISS